MTGFRFPTSVWDWALRSPDEGGAGDGSAAGAGTGGGDAGGGSSPPLPTTGTEPRPSSEPDDFPDIPDSDDLDYVVAPQEPVAQPVAAGGRGAPSGAQPGSQPGAGAPPPAAPAPVAAQAPQAPPAQPQPQAAPVAQPQAAAAEPISLGNIVERLNAQADELQETWAKEIFALRPEDVEALTTNPEVAFPRLAARILFHAAQMIPHQIQQFVPKLIADQAAASQASRRAENEFYTAWPGLPRTAEAENAVTQAAKALRAANPNMNRAQLIHHAGTVACSLLGLDIATMRAKAPNANGAVTHAPGNGQVPPVAMRSPGFVPAGSAAPLGTSGAGPAGAGGDDPWDGFTLPNSD